MVGATLGHYRILAKVGEGGMGEVFRAEDTVLKRQVALKILPLEVADNPERLARFRREAESLAALNHPGIVTIFSVESALPRWGAEGSEEPDELPSRELQYLTMELVKGRPLSRLIPAEGVSLDTLIDIGIQLADAISVAHAEGVIHRDLKPGNVMVTDDGRVKVLDFGLAKMRGAVESQGLTQTLTETLTTEGAVVGTVPYMSPEQLEGRAVDSRSDIFSLGILLYEMATGARPFLGDNPISLISSIVKDTPPEVDVVRQDLPHDLSRIVAHCLEKDPADRLQSALDVRNALRTLREEIDSGAVVSSSRPGVGGRSGFQNRRWLLALALVSIVVLAALFLRRPEAPEPLLGFAERDWVLITDFAHPDGEEDLAEALALALRIGLEESGYVNVVPRSRIDNTLAMMRRNKGDPIDLTLGREICQRGGVKALLAPELAKVGSQYLVTLSLIAPSTGETVASFSERSADQNGLLGTIEMLIDRLRRELGESLPGLTAGEADLEFVTTSSLQALMRYSKGRRQWYLGQHQAAVELFEEAVQIDPRFASAYAALGNAYSAYVFNDPDRSRAYYEQALALLDEVAERERYFIQASFQSHFGEPEEAIYSFRRYLDRFPDDAAAHYNLGGIYRDLGDCDQATGEYRTVLELDPENAGALINIATCVSSRDPETAVALYQRAFQIRPEWETSGNLNHEYGLTLLTIGDEQGARDTFAKRFEAAAPAERGAAQRSFGQLSIYGGRFDEAAEHFESAALLHEEVPESAGRDLLLWSLGEIARGQPARATELLGQARELIPMSSGWIWMHSIVGLTYLAASDLDSARQISAGLDSWASQNDESGIDALRRREILAASVMAAAGDVGQALDTLEAIQEIEQADNGFLSWALAEVALEAHDWKRAEAALEDLIGLNWVFYETLVPWVQAHYKLGFALDELGRADAAEAHYRRFLEIWGEADSPVAEVSLARQRLERDSP